VLQELTHIVTDPAHLIAEGVTEMVSFLAGVIYVRIKLRNRDRRHNHDGVG
jgi:hypothetical protein